MTGNWRTPRNIGLLLLLVVIAAGFVAIYGAGAAAERDALRAIALREGRDAGSLILATQWLTWVGDSAQRSLFGIACAAWLLWKQRVRAAAIMLIVPQIGAVTCSILKEAFARARPEVVPHLDTFSNLSFPSGHAANPMAILLTAALLLPSQRKGLWIGLAIAGGLIIGATRPLLGVHWPSDVVAGWAWGVGWALIALAAARYWRA
jgi:undecaprenyl-diphosphatase